MSQINPKNKDDFQIFLLLRMFGGTHCIPDIIKIKVINTRESPVHDQNISRDKSSYWQ